MFNTRSGWAHQMWFSKRVSPCSTSDGPDTARLRKYMCKLISPSSLALLDDRSGLRSWGDLSGGSRFGGLSCWRYGAGRFVHQKNRSIVTFRRRLEHPGTDTAEQTVARTVLKMTFASETAEESCFSIDVEMMLWYFTLHKNVFKKYTFYK